ncbi:MAG: integrase catalytic subunit [Chloroflexi bacterium]|nr:MAG: integrase catalytic subunit [Chloroflexota bacterium]
MKYQFVAKHHDKYPVGRICALLGISRSGYYAWKNRKPSQREHKNQALLDHIRRIHKMNRKAYGSPRVYAQLKKDGYTCNQKTVARMMRQDGLKGQRKYRRVVTTNSKHSFPVAPNLLNRDFYADRPNQKWVGDITYIPTAEGWLYLASVLDLFSRKVVGWEMSSYIDADLVEKALRMAFYRRQPNFGLLHHSDRGSQYASHQIRNILVANRVQVSMSGKGDCYDNAVMESFFGTLKNEWVHHQKYQTRSQARTDIFGYIEAYYRNNVK